MRTKIGIIILLAMAFITFNSASALAQDCAFKDANDNGVLDAGDTVLLDAAWANGHPFTSPVPFVVPPGCTVLPKAKVELIATKITVKGSILSTGFAVSMKADASVGTVGDGSFHMGGESTTSRIFAGKGVDNFFPATVPAVGGLSRTVALWSKGECTFDNAAISVANPIGQNPVTIFCEGDMLIHKSSMEGSQINIQSLGKINAAGSTSLLQTLADFCGGHFPCTVPFATAGFDTPTFKDNDELLAFCLPTGGGTPSTFKSANDPVIFIAEDDLNLAGASISAHAKAFLVSVTGNVNLQGAHIDNVFRGVPTPGGQTRIGATVALVERTGASQLASSPSSGTINIQDACIEVFSLPVDVLNTDALLGTPAPASNALIPATHCAQNPPNPPDFKFVNVITSK